MEVGEPRSKGLGTGSVEIRPIGLGDGLGLRL